MLTSLGGRTTTVRTARPSRARTTAGSDVASSRSSSSPIDGGTSRRARTLPATCTTHVTVSSTSRVGSATGQPASATVGSCPSRSHMSSAVYGANSDSMTATASTASRTAGSAAPGPLSTALRVALTSSMTRATATLKRIVSTARVASSTARAVARRSATSPASGAVPRGLVTSPDSRQARARNFAEPVGETSAQSMSSSGGPANTIVRRIASTPCADSSSDSRTRLPRDLLIAEPSMTTMPWFSSRVNGSVNETIPMSYRTLVKNRAYSRCRIACVMPPTYWSTGSHFSTSATSNGTSSRPTEQYRRKYQDESTNVSIVSVSRSAGPPQRGQSTLTQSVAAPSGEVPLGCRSSPALGGSVTGSWSSGTGTSPSTGQWMIGIGV